MIRRLKGIDADSLPDKVIDFTDLREANVTQALELLLELTIINPKMIGLTVEIDQSPPAGNDLFSPPASKPPLGGSE